MNICHSISSDTHTHTHKNIKRTQIKNFIPFHLNANFVFFVTTCTLLKQNSIFFSNIISWCLWWIKWVKKKKEILEKKPRTLCRANTNQVRKIDPKVKQLCYYGYRSFIFFFFDCCWFALVWGLSAWIDCCCCRMWKHCFLIVYNRIHRRKQNLTSSSRIILHQWIIMMIIQKQTHTAWIYSYFWFGFFFSKKKNFISFKEKKNSL